MTSTELAVATSDETSLAQLDRHAVVELLERGKTWLQQALSRDTEIGDFVDYKGEASVLRELVVQKELGKDAELAATELVRRAERAIGLAIRKAQAEGTVTSEEHPHQGPRRDYERNGKTVHCAGPVDQGESSCRPPTSFGLSKDELSRGIYPQADGVSDDQFNQAVEQAREEGNLSRANVVRKVQGQPRPAPRRPDVLRKTRRFDSTTVIQKTVQAAADVITPSLLDEVDFAELEAEDLTEWVSSLADSIKALHGLKSRLSKELTQRG